MVKDHSQPCILMSEGTDYPFCQSNLSFFRPDYCSGRSKKGLFV